MKVPIALAVILGSLALLRGEEIAGQEVRTPPETTEATLPDRITDGTPALPPAPVEKPEFQIESTQVKRVDVVEAPELPDLPPVVGRITIIYLLANPEKPKDVKVHFWKRDKSATNSQAKGDQP